MKIVLKDKAFSPHLSHGAGYLVLETYDDMVRIVDDGGAPALFPLSLFVVVDETIPASWGSWRDEDGVESSGPETFAVPGFFEWVFDRKPDAIEQFLELADLDDDAQRRFKKWSRPWPLRT